MTHRDAWNQGPQTADDGFIAALGHPTHVHDFHQFLYAPLGCVVVTALGTDHGLSPSVGLWLPAGVPHCARFGPDSLVMAESFDTEPHVLPYTEATVVNIGDRKRRMLLSRMRSGRTDPGDAYLFAALTDGHERCLALPRPTGGPARTVTAGLLRDPADQRTATQWAEDLHTSSTSLRRAFRKETGLAFTEWRTRLRLNRSLELLDQGLMVGAVAARVGFTSTNGYIVAFRRHFGCTPGAFVRASRHSAA
ncbi:AraC family transcriptional regulator [Streptomyces sp. SID8352]|uniref:helix-turn-helix domain-containing protein n=1 Tax=Streptomyces sp. SID8352 TaxID=2690338 RepID=UPI0031F6CF77